MILMNSKLIFEGDTTPNEEIEELKEVEETLDEYPEPDENTLDEIETEAVRDFASLEAASYIIDVVTVETAVFKGEEAGKAVLENAVTDMFKKIKEFIMKIAKKIKAFFLKLITNIKVFFMNGKDFVKKYKDELSKKAKDGFEKSYHKMNYNKIGAVDNLAKTFKGTSDRLSTSISDSKNFDKEFDHAEKSDYTDDEFEKELRNIANVNSIGEIKEYLQKECGIFYDKELIIEFKSGPSVSDMIKYVEDSDKIIKEAQEAQKENESFYSKLLSQLDKAEKKANDTENETLKSRYLTTIKRQISLTRKYQSVVLECRKSKIDVATAMQKETISVLKSFMYFNPKVEKNSADFGYGSNSNMFDSVLF